MVVDLRDILEMLEKGGVEQGFTSLVQVDTLAVHGRLESHVFNMALKELVEGNVDQIILDRHLIRCHVLKQAGSLGNPVIESSLRLERLLLRIPRDVGVVRLNREVCDVIKLLVHRMQTTTHLIPVARAIASLIDIPIIQAESNLIRTIRSWLKLPQ